MIGVNRFAIKYSVVVVVIWNVTRHAQNLLTVLVSKCGTIPGWRNVGMFSRTWCSICHGTSSFSIAVYVQKLAASDTYAWRSTGIASWRAID